MMESNNPQNFDLIEAYLTNQMSEEDREIFELQMKENQSLRNEIAIQRELITSIELGGLNESLSKIMQSHDIALKSPKSRQIWAWAASIALVLAVSIWLLALPDKHDKLFASHASADPGLPVPMSATDHYSFYDAMVDYKVGNYAKARGKFEAILLTNPPNDTLNYFVAACYFGEGQYETAIENYENPILANSDEWSDKAEWYSFLSLVKLKKQAEINSYSPNESSPYFDQIKAIQAELKD